MQDFGSGTAPISVSSEISGLDSNTIYHFRLVSINLKGETKGADQHFTTDTIWARTYDRAESERETPDAILRTADGGYIVAGIATSEYESVYNFWILKLEASGVITWEKTFNVSHFEHASDVQQTADGGYIISGSTGRDGAGSFDLSVLKINSDGTYRWAKSYGGAHSDTAKTILQTADGGYIILGNTASFGSGSKDLWVLKLSPNGSIAWQKAYGGPDHDQANSIGKSSDGGYIIAGQTNSFGDGDTNAWVLKLNSDGTIAWQKRYGGAGEDSSQQALQTTDSGFIIAGGTNSYGASLYGSDLWILKLDAVGNVEWQKTHGRENDDTTKFLQQTIDGGFIIACDTNSFQSDLYHSDIWIVKLNEDGTIHWQKTYGGILYDSACAIRQTADEGYIILGSSNSFGVIGDFWILKTGHDGSLGCGLGVESSALTFTPDAIGIATDAAVVDTTASVVNISLSGENTAAVVTSQCP